jgi:DNA polymerase elongation subunit (family B)
MKKEGFKILFSDTDSIFAQLKEEIKDWAGVTAAMDEINGHVQKTMGSEYLTLAIEEVVRRISFIDGRKAYAGLLDEYNRKEWVRGADINGTEKLKLRGIAWSKQEKRQRDVVEKKLKEFLLSDKSGEVFYNEILIDLKS